ncbi:alpha/beta hydrolase [soil metagenome]
MTEFAYCRLQPSGHKVGYVSRGTGPLVIFLHGFPDTHRGFLPAMDAVAAIGFHAVAPEPRGYAPTDIPADGDYRVEAFAKDVLGIADALGAQRFSIVGHDWGALTAYAVSNLAPGRVDRLITAAVPHTGHFLLNIRLHQALRSRYMALFQLRGIAERVASRDNFAYIERLLHTWSPTWDFDETVMGPLRAAYADRPRLTAALSYYRGLAPSLVSAESRRLIFSPVSTPTRMIFGTEDGCIGPELFRDQRRRFQRPLDLVPMVGSGHFMHWEQPDEFIEQIISFIGDMDSVTPVPPV